MTSRSEECAIEIPFTCQDEITNYRISRCLTDGNRCPSQSSSLNSNAADICRICHCEGAPDLPLITPCYCAGSLRYVHQTCLQQWIKSSNIKSCELCKFQFIMQTKVKPFSEWEYLEMSGLERKKLACAMLFHIIAMTCVCWSLYVLIDRTMDEVYKGHLEWPFWTKLIVVGIGFMGGIVFMYIQCRAYFVLCKRWKAYNRVIYVQNAPEKLTSKYAKQQGATGSPEAGGGPSCSFKTDTHKRGGLLETNCMAHKRSSLHETNCIDIKGVRNLHIFFGGENQIRVHRNDRTAGGETRALAHEENGRPEPGRGGGAKSSSEKYGNASLRIQIGGGADRTAGGGAVNGCRNGGPMSGAGCESKMGLLRSVDCQPAAEAGSAVEKCAGDEFKGGVGGGDQSVVKLQIKKAEIVIEFGKQNGDDEPPTKPVRSSGWGQHQWQQRPKQQQPLDAVDRCEAAAYSPKRKFSSEEYLDAEAKYVEKIANETNESPTSKLLVSHRNSKVPFNNFFKERTSLKDWKSSEDLLDVRASAPKF